MLILVQKEIPMDFGLFEQYPILLVAFIIVTVEIWNMVRGFIMAQIMHLRKTPRT